MAARKTSPKRATYHHGDLSRALVEGAVRLIQEAGPDAVSIRELSRRIGVNHAAVYRHYQDKDALLAAVAEDGWTQLAEAMSRSVASADAGGAGRAVDRLLLMGAAYARFALANPAHYAVMTGPRLNERGRFPALEVPIQRAFDLLIGEFVIGRAAGLFTGGGDPRDWALRVWMFAHGYVTLVAGRRLAVRPSRVEEYFEALLRPMLAPDDRE